MKYAGLKVSVALILLAILAGAGWLLLQPKSATTFQLPNGMIVSYLGSARGGATFNTERSWHRLARKALPMRLQQWIPQALVTSAGGTSNSITVFWSVLNPGGAPITGAPWGDYAAEDDDGLRYERGGGYSSFNISAGQCVFGLQLRTFPRRQRDFLFQFLDNTGAVLHSVRLPNPMTGSFAEWTPESLPIKQTNEPVVLTLVSVAEGASGQHRFLRPDWKIFSSHPLWAQARVSYFQCEDATGNEGAFLSLKEPAWKIRAWVHRRDSKDFTDTEKLTLTNFAIPGPGEIQSIDATGKCSEVQLRVQCFAGIGSLYITNGTNLAMVASAARSSRWSSSSDGKNQLLQWDSPTPFFLVQAIGIGARDDVRFRVRDEQGREVKLEISGGSYGFGPNDARYYKPGLMPSQDVKTVSLEIIVSRPREFEFIIHPSDINRLPPASN